MQDNDKSKPDNDCVSNDLRLVDTNKHLEDYTFSNLIKQDEYQKQAIFVSNYLNIIIIIVHTNICHTIILKKIFLKHILHKN